MGAISSHKLHNAGSNSWLDRRTLVAFFFGIIVFGQTTPLRAQSQADSVAFSVEWVETLSSASAKKPGLIDRVVRMVFGHHEYELIRPVGVYVPTPDSVWILDQGSGTVSLLERTSGRFRPLSAGPEGIYPSLVGISGLGSQGILFSDSQHGKVFIRRKGTNHTELLNKDRSFSRPTGVAYLPSTGHIWVAETGAHRLVEMDREGQLIKTVGRRGTAPGEFNFPTSLWIDSQGHILVVDAMNFRIQILDEDGNVRSVFGQPGDASGFMARPKGIAADSYGHIYVVDALFNTVQVFDQKGVFLTNFGSQGRDNGLFWLPSGIYIDASDRIYVADSYNKRIQVFELKREKRP